MSSSLLLCSIRQAITLPSLLQVPRTSTDSLKNLQANPCIKSLSFKPCMVAAGS